MRILLLLLGFGVVAMAQQGSVPSDQDRLHRTVFKNSYLLVLHVIIPPGQSTGFHTHSRDAIAVRLSDAKTKMQDLGKEPGEVIDHHPGQVTANDYVKSPLTHKVINAGDTNFDVLDIEAFKRSDGPHGEPIGPVAAENASMRVYRYELAAGESTPQHAHEHPYLIVAATPMELKMTSPDGLSSSHPVKPGDLHWVDQKVTHTLTNNGKEKAVIVEVELK
jgi:quercetin dioxygenase-like cupin family protein